MIEEYEGTCAECDEPLGLVDIGDVDGQAAMRWDDFELTTENTFYGVKVTAYHLGCVPANKGNNIMSQEETSDARFFAYVELKDEMAAFGSRIRKLVEVIEPFAEWIKVQDARNDTTLGPTLSDNTSFAAIRSEGEVLAKITFGDFRRAAEAIAPVEENDNGSE